MTQSLKFIETQRKQTYVSSFDPIIFLGINGISEESKIVLRENLISQISEYILISILDTLPDSIDKELEDNPIRDISDLEKFLSLSVPRYKELVNKFLNEFKDNFNNDQFSGKPSK